MELTTEQKEELKSVIEKNPQGLTFNELYSKAKSFSDEAELSSGIHEIMKEGECVKINGKYHPKNIVQVIPTSAVDPVTEEIKNLLDSSGITLTQQAMSSSDEDSGAVIVEHKVVQGQVKRTSVELAEAPKIKVPPCGSLRRSSTKGVIAYALYKVRGDALSRKDINLLFTDETTPGAIYQAIFSLLSLGMIEKANNEFTNTLYRWSDQFGYPFPQCLKEDKHIVPFKDYEEFLKFRARTLGSEIQEVKVLVKTGNSEVDGVCSIPANMTIDGVDCLLSDKANCDVAKEADRTVPYKPVSEALSMIRASISHHEAQIAMLRNLESKLEMAV